MCRLAKKHTLPVEESCLNLNWGQRFADVIHAFYRVKFAEWSVTQHNKYAEYFLLMPIYYCKQDVFICLGSSGTYGPAEDERTNRRDWSFR